MSDAEAAEAGGDVFAHRDGLPEPAVMESVPLVEYGQDDGRSPMPADDLPRSLRAVLVVERGERGFERHAMREANSILGRTEGFPSDLNIPFDHLLSAAHAMFSYSGGKLVVRDNDSLNGIYLKVERQALLRDGQRIRMGSMVFRFEILAPTIENRGERPAAQLVAIGDGGEDGSACRLTGEKTVIGRESGTYTFPGDRLLSARHAQFATADGVFKVENLSQANGTFVQIDERVLEQGDTLLIGAQIIRVEYE